MSFASRRLAPLGLVVLTTACAHTGVWREAKRAPADAHVLAIAGLRQQGSACGPTALTVLLNAAGDSVSVDEVTAAVQNKDANAALTIDLLLYARGRGFRAQFAEGSLDTLRQTLLQRIPPLLLLDIGAGLPWPASKKHLWHYVVPYGFSDAKHQFFLHSGVGAKSISFEKLSRLWARGGHWMMTLGVPVREPASKPGVAGAQGPRHTARKEWVEEER